MAEVIRIAKTAPQDSMEQKIGEHTPGLSEAFKLRSIVFNNMQSKMTEVLRAEAPVGDERILLVDAVSIAMQNKMRLEFDSASSDNSADGRSRRSAWYYADLINRYINFAAHLDSAHQLDPRDVPVLQAAIRLRNTAVANYQITGLIGETEDLEHEISPALDVLTKIKDTIPTKGEAALATAITLVLGQLGAGVIFTRVVRAMGPKVKKRTVFAEGRWLDVEAVEGEMSAAYKELVGRPREVTFGSGQPVRLAPDGLNLEYLGAAFFAQQPEELFRYHNKWIGYTRLFRNFIPGFQSQLFLEGV